MTDETTPEQPPRMVGMNGEPAGIRSFSMNSREFYEAVTEPRPSWCWGPGLPRDARSWLPRAIPGVEWVPDSETGYPF